MRFAACLAVVVAAACSRDRAPARADSVAVAVADTILPPPRTMSRFDVPLRYDFTPVLAVVERAVPTIFGSLDSVHMVGNDSHKHYAFMAKRDSFTTFAHGAEVHLRTTLSYEARGFYKPLVGPTLSAGCGSGKENQRPKIVIELVTPLTLSRDWHLRTASELARLAPASDSAKDRCHVSILSYDVTDRVVEAARSALNGHLVDIDKKVGAIDLTERATGWWKLLNRPIELADGVWLMLQPQRMRLGSVTGEGHTLTVKAGLDAFPKIVTGVEPQPTVSPLPPLARDSAGTGFQILLEGAVDYVTASRAMTEALSGKTFTQAGRTVTVRSITVSPDIAGHLALAVAFTGDAKGTLRFVGTPLYKQEIGMIVVPDLNYDLKTDNGLINAYAWLKSDKLLALFREKAQVPVAPVLERGKALLVNGLNRKIGGVMTLSATVDSVAVRGLFVMPAGLMVRAGAAGKARVSVRQSK